MSAPGTAVAILRAMLADAVPGQWDAHGGHVASVSEIPLREVNGRSDPDSLRYYGGYLVCESCDRKDAGFIAAAHNLLPDLLDGYDEMAHRMWKLELELRSAKLALEDAEQTIEYERSRRYVAPLRPLERAGLIRIFHDNRVETTTAIGVGA
jgi:hypothetical protein